MQIPPNIELEEPMDSVHLRLPKNIRARIAELTTANKTSEAKMIRWIIQKFFADMDTNCTQQEKQYVSGSEAATEGMS